MHFLPVRVGLKHDHSGPASLRIDLSKQSWFSSKQNVWRGRVHPYRASRTTGSEKTPFRTLRFLYMARLLPPVPTQTKMSLGQSVASGGSAVEKDQVEGRNTSHVLRLSNEASVTSDAGCGRLERTRRENARALRFRASVYVNGAKVKRNSNKSPLPCGVPLGRLLHCCVLISTNQCANVIEYTQDHAFLRRNADQPLLLATPHALSCTPGTKTRMAKRKSVCDEGRTPLRYCRAFGHYEDTTALDHRVRRI